METMDKEAYEIKKDSMSELNVGVQRMLAKQKKTNSWKKK